MIKKNEIIEVAIEDVLTKVDEVNDRSDLIILDPHRSGVNHKALRKIINFNPSEII